jgi:Glycosyl hydrolase catalytic core
MLTRSLPSASAPARACRRTIVALLAAAGLLALLLAAAPRAEARTQVGLMDPAYAAQEPEKYWADVEKLRPAFLRYEVHWNEIAPKRPKKQRNPGDPAYRWGYLDDVVREANAHGYMGCDLIATIWRTPRWASSLKRKRHNYAHMPRVQSFRNFVAALAKRYSGSYDPDGAGPLTTLPQIACWEIWNEPNFNGALRPQKTKKKGKKRQLTSAINYTRLLNAAYAEIKAVGKKYDFKPQVIGGALYRQTSPKGVGPIAFMRKMKQRKAKFDVLSIHPYNGIPRLGIRDGAGAGTRWPNIAIGNFHRFLREVNRTWRGRKFSIWVTEYGWQTKTGRRDQYAISEKNQAKFLRQSINTFRKKYRRVGRITWFLIRDEPVKSEDGRKNTWQSGFRRLNGKKKPSYVAWLRLKGVAKRSADR